jgi:uncharacterized protein with HEPN domain
LPSKNPVQRFEDILRNIDLVKKYTRGISYGSYIADQKTRDAVERCLARISEAASKLENSAEALIPDQPWSDIRGIGNIIRHEYDSVDPLIIWNIISKDLDRLGTAVEAALEKLRRQSPNAS